MPKLGQKGVVHILVLLLLLVGLGVGLYLVQNPTFFNPKAGGGISAPIKPPIASFSLEESIPSTYTPGSKIQVEVLMRSDLYEANLFAAYLKFPPNLLQVDSIQTAPQRRTTENPPYREMPVQTWVENYKNNDEGIINLVAAIPSPGYKTNSTDPQSRLATIVFKVREDLTGQLGGGQTPGGGPITDTATIDFAEDSAIYRDSDNVNILEAKNGLKVTVTTEPLPSPTPSPTLPPVCFVEGAGGDPRFSCPTGYYCYVFPCNAPPGAVCGYFAECRPDSSPSPTPPVCTTNADCGGGIYFCYMGQCMHGDPPPPPPSATPVACPKLDCQYGAVQTGVAANGCPIYACVPPPSPTPGQRIWCRLLDWPGWIRNRFDCPKLVRSLPPQSPVPLPVPSISPVPNAQKGDGNQDGKLDLVDLSMCYSYMNPARPDFPKEIDLDGDGKISNNDCLMEKDLLIKNGVLRS